VTSQLSTRILAAVLLCTACTGGGAGVSAHPSPLPLTTTTAAPETVQATPSPPSPRTVTVPPRKSVSSLPPALVWAPNRVPAAVVAVAAHLAHAATVDVANGTVWLQGRQGDRLSTPIDVSAADPTLYAAAVPGVAAAMAHLSSGQVVLSLDSARLRGLGVGDRVSLATVSLRVAAVVPDRVVGYAEMFVSPSDGRRLGLPPDRYLVVRPSSRASWPAMAAALARAIPAGAPVRVLPPGRARILREADAVLSPLEEKLRFGEFTADTHSQDGGALAIDSRWVQRHIQTATVPVLGRVTCNTAFLPQLRAALAALVRAGLQSLVNRSDYGGCFNARLIAGRTGESISHHAYGSAIDLNVAANPAGRPSAQDRRLVRIFGDYGLTWGGRWLVPDGMHFEALDAAG